MNRKLLLPVTLCIILIVSMVAFYGLPKVIEVPPLVLLSSAYVLVSFFWASIGFSVYQAVKGKPYITQRIDGSVILAGIIVTLIAVGVEGAPFNPFTLYPQTWEYIIHPEKFSELAHLKYNPIYVNTGNKPQYP